MSILVRRHVAEKEVDFAAFLLSHVTKANFGDSDAYKLGNVANLIFHDSRKTNQGVHFDAIANGEIQVEAPLDKVSAKVGQLVSTVDNQGN